jgi:D-hexose-6-phosphate mutarotase
MNDLNENDWKKFICLETGIISNSKLLAPKKSSKHQLIISEQF